MYSNSPCFAPYAANSLCLAMPFSIESGERPGSEVDGSGFAILWRHGRQLRDSPLAVRNSPKHEVPQGAFPFMDSSTIRHLVETTTDNVERVIIGKRREVELVLVALLCRGHVLIEDVPGVGKTVLTKAIARSIGSSFKRIQFTPDLLPSDVTGVNVFNPRSSGFEFRPGPIFGQLVLADEINRATPKTQAALLEAMEEAQVTVDGVTHPLPAPFIVLATQNPIEYEGT